ncbi:gliding motility-associated C-terminal domain-containing protein [Flavobacteriaceae bacterium TK19130]|nr:gliding motility-associated C-terminal domain-containing protein [Thermobacterium salinum]
MRRLVPYLIHVLISLLLLVGATSTMMAQDATYASQVTFEDHVDNATNAVGNTPDFATLNSYGGIAIGIGQFSGELELAFPEEIPANTTTYIRIDLDSDVLNALLGGSLGDLLADILGTVVLGDHYIDVEARDGSNTVLSRSSSLPLNDGRLRIVQDGQQNFYIAITPDQPYDRIYIEDNTDALLLGTTNSMNVYSAFYYTDNQCAINPLYTDYDGSGITLDLLNIGGAGVTNPHHVIDNDTTNFSEISLGVVGVAASIEQNVYFANQYQPSDSLEIKLSTNPTLVNLGLLNNVEVIAYDGTNEVFSESIQTFLTADLLTLLQNGETATIPIGPNTVFDRVTVRLSSLLNVNIAQSLDLYGITVMAPPAPTTENDSQIFCEVNDPSVEDLQTNETNVLWYPTEVVITPLDPSDPLVDGETYYATQIIDGCESSARLAVSVTINDTPTPTTTETDQTFCAVDEPTVAELQADGPNITWYDMAEDGTAYDSTDVLVSGQTYYAASTNATGCESSIRLEVMVTINDTPTPTTTDTDQTLCAVDDPTVADLQADGPNITWYDMAEGGTPYDPTDALVNGQTYYAAATNTTGCKSSTRLEVTVTINDTPTPTTTDTDQTFCAVDDPTVADLQADGPNIVWYDMAEDGTAYDPTDVLEDGQTYYAAATNTTGCESNTRLEVTVTINDTPTPTTTETDQVFCAVDEPTVADLQADGPNIVWYNMAEGGTAYDPSDTLIGGQTYYASATGATGCESSERLAVNVTIDDTPTPTTTNMNQTFCAVDEPTVADLQADGPNIVWYDMDEGGTAYDPTDTLIDGQIYYASANGSSGCESSERLAVTVTINDTPAPTTDNETQVFCTTENPTIADLQADGNTLIWYDMPEGGTPYAATDPLVDGVTYYASATDASGCESSERLAITVEINEGSSPTITSNASGETCLETTITYTTEEGNANYLWSVTGGLVTDGGGATDSFITVQWISLEDTSVSVSYEPMNDCNTGEEVTFIETVVVCADITISKTVNEESPVIGDEVQYTISVTNEGSNDFQMLEISENIPSGLELINFNTTLGTYNPNTGVWMIDLLPSSQTATLTIAAEVLGSGDYTNIASIVSSDPVDENSGNNSSEVTLTPQCLTVYNEFSPNSDGINDQFTITCIENYPNNELKVFNRYGSLVYRKQGYENDWEGISNVDSGQDSDGLPTGTYYYVLELDRNAEPKSGWIYLMK